VRRREPRRSEGERGSARKGAASPGSMRSMLKKLVIVAVLVALGIVAARRLRPS
jgi:hypothetical protein